MQLRFIFPQYLWLLLLLVPIWLLGWVGARRVAGLRFWLSMALRTLILLALVGSIAGAQLAQPLGDITTVFLLDGSDSIALSQRARAETFIQAALRDMPPDARAGVVVFGRNALVDRQPGQETVLGQITTVPAGSATNIHDAIQLGMAMMPDAGYQRLVLLSDGGENQSDALTQARQAAASGVPIDVVQLSGTADGLDAQVASVSIPANARAGQALRMRIGLESTADTTGVLTVEGPGGLTVVQQQVDVRAGTTEYDLVLPEALPNFNRYVVRLDVTDDARTENNVADAYSFVSGQPRVLVVEGSSADGRALTESLRSAQLDVTETGPQGLPASLGDLAQYDAVILANVPRRAISDAQQSALSVFVHDLGRGLLMVGGDQSFGAGGWRDSPVEAALPVQMDIPSQYVLPPTSIVVLIDVSGSMGQEESGRTKLSLAAEGAMRIADVMRPTDEMTVVLFDSAPSEVVGPLPGTERQRIIDQLEQVEVGGGGINIYDGLNEAARYLRQSKNPIRHLITLTDGGDTVQQEGALDFIRTLREERVTVTSIAIGDGEHVPFIRQMASVGGGRTFLTERAAQLPTILADEAQVVLQPYLIEEPLTPGLVTTHPAIRNLTAMPELGGYVLTTPRQSAQVLLASPTGDPILSAWQYGLGRSLAFTSDMSGRWGQQWIQWQQFPQVSAQMLGWLLPNRSVDRLNVQSSTEGDALVLVAEARDERGEPLAGLTQQARLIAADGTVRDVPLREIAPGRYQARVNDAEPGAYLVQLTATTADGQPFDAATAGAVVPRSAEYRSNAANPGLLAAIARETQGTLGPEPAQVFRPSGTQRGAVSEIGLPLLWLALLVLPFDIAVRRLFPARRRLLPQRAAPAPRPAVSAAPPAPRPQPAPVAPPAAPPAAPTNLDRLREAQERARRRARGEE